MTDNSAYARMARAGYEAMIAPYRVGIEHAGVSLEWDHQSAQLREDWIVAAKAMCGEAVNLSVPQTITGWQMTDGLHFLRSDATNGRANLSKLGLGRDAIDGGRVVYTGAEREIVEQNRATSMRGMAARVEAIQRDVKVAS